MRKLLLLALLALGLPALSYAQGSYHRDVAFALRGGVLVPAASALVTVCTGPASGAPCTPKADIFSNDGLTLAKSNPITTSSLGAWDFFAEPGTYYYTLTGPGIVSQGPIRIEVGQGPAGANGTNGTNGTNGAPGECTVGDDACAIKPAATEGLQYVSPNGNDSNDGLSWGTAKLTIYGACIALPGGDDSPATCGQGIILLNHEAGEFITANPTSGAGIWFLRSGDPNYASPPAGWLRKNGALTIEGVGCPQFTSFARSPQCLILAGNATDNLHPAVWIATMNTPLLLKNVKFQYPGVAFKIGIDSDNVRTGASGDVAGMRLDNVGGSIDQTLGHGPCMDVGSQVYWLEIDHFSCFGNAEERIIIADTSGLVRSSNVVTVTTDTPHSMTTGDRVGIVNPDDATFAGSFTVTGSADTTHFTYAQVAPDATSQNGVAFSDKAHAIVIDPGATGLGSGLITIKNSVFGGSIRFWGGTSGGGLTVEDVTLEGAWTEPFGGGVWVGSIPSPTSTYISVTNVQTADMVDTPALRIDSVPQSSSVYLSNYASRTVGFGLVGNGVDTQGPGTFLGGAQPTPEETKLPRQKYQVGVIGGHLYGQLDTDSGVPVRVRYPNIVNSFPGAGANPTWSASQFCGATTYTTTGVTDPEGTTRAVRAENDSNGCQNSLVFYNNNRTVAAGDIFIAAVRVRSTAAAGGYSGSSFSPLSLSLGGATVKNEYSFSQTAVSRGDGEWEWVYRIMKVASTSSATVQVSFSVTFQLSAGIEAFSPVLYHIAAGTISDNEAFNLAANIRSYYSACAVGWNCNSTGPVPDGLTPLAITVANASSTGTTLNKLAKLTGAPSTALIAATTDTSGIIGVVVGHAGTAGDAIIAVSGIVSCVFDSATTAGDYVRIDASTAGNCDDAGSTFPTSGQVIGRVLSTNGGGGTYQVQLFNAIQASSVDLASPGAIGGTSPGAGTFTTLTANTSATAPLYKTTTNCADSAGAAACGAAPAGAVVIDAAATSVVVSTTAVTSTSRIFLQYDSSLGTELSVTCNTTAQVPVVTARTAATSFTVTIPAGPVTNPLCLSYVIVN